MTSQTIAVPPQRNDWHRRGLPAWTYHSPAMLERETRYLARRIDRETYLKDIQLSIWSNESMKSSAFEDFHLSDLECGVKSHHDHIRAILPVANLRNRPGEDQVAAFKPFVFVDGMKPPGMSTRPHRHNGRAVHRAGGFA